eukprot:5120890-Amphidinium_carterae.3
MAVCYLVDVGTATPAPYMVELLNTWLGFSHYDIELKGKSQRAQTQIDESSRRSGQVISENPSAQIGASDRLADRATVGIPQQSSGHVQQGALCSLMMATRQAEEGRGMQPKLLGQSTRKSKNMPFYLIQAAVARIAP